MSPFLRKLHGFIAQKLGAPHLSGRSKDYSTGWFVGAGIKVIHWYYASPEFGHRAYRVSFFIQTRNNLGFKFSSIDAKGRRIKALLIGFMAIGLSFKINNHE
jgi:hypothetical protein